MIYQHNDNGLLTTREYFSVGDSERFVGTHHYGFVPLGSYVDDGFGNGVRTPNPVALIQFGFSDQGGS